MSASRVPVNITVKMGGRDVTEYVESVQVIQPANALCREFQLTFRAWTNIQPAERWDIWASYDEGAADAELLIRQGVVPPDRQLEVVVEEGAAPLLTVKGYDSVWLAQRRTPLQTIVLAGSAADAAQAIERYTGPIGRYRLHILPGMSMSQVVGYLAQQAGFLVECRIPNRTVAPFVVPPESSYWRAISDLVAPWAPYIYYKAETNTVVISDPISAQSGVGPKMNIPAELIQKIHGMPSYTKKIQRVLITVAQ